MARRSAGPGFFFNSPPVLGGVPEGRGGKFIRLVAGYTATVTSFISTVVVYTATVTSFIGAVRVYTTIVSKCMSTVRYCTDTVTSFIGAVAVYTNKVSMYGYIFSFLRFLGEGNAAE